MAIALFVFIVLGTLAFILRVNTRPGRRVVWMDSIFLGLAILLVLAIVAVFVIDRVEAA